MALLKTKDEEVTVTDGDGIIDACEEMGIPFGCQSGICKTCEIIVHDGMENLSEKSEAEKEHALEENHRLACQCKILQGAATVKHIHDN